MAGPVRRALSTVTTLLAMVATMGPALCSTSLAAGRPESDAGPNSNWGMLSSALSNWGCDEGSVDAQLALGGPDEWAGRGRAAGSSQPRSLTRSSLEKVMVAVPG